MQLGLKQATASDLVTAPASPRCCFLLLTHAWPSTEAPTTKVLPLNCATAASIWASEIG